MQQVFSKQNSMELQNHYKDSGKVKQAYSVFTVMPVCPCMTIVLYKWTGMVFLFHTHKIRT